MQMNVRMMQEQLAAITAQIYSGQIQCGWPMGGDMSIAGGYVNAGMRGPFSTLPSGMSPSMQSMFPHIPSFPLGMDGQASEPSTMAPPSPLLTPSAPPTPSHQSMGPPSIGSSPGPPPGLPAIPGMPYGTPSPSPFGTPSHGPCPPPPPGLEESLLDELLPPAKTSAAISLSDAIDATPEKAPQTLEESERQALKFMQSHKDTADDREMFLSPKATPKSHLFLSPKVSSDFLSPKPRQPGQLNGTPSRNTVCGLNINVTPKKTPNRLSLRGTPGMRSPAICASPFVICEGGGTVFGFTIRKADDCGLGVDFQDSDCGSCLQVTSVKPGGAMQAWNKLCAGGPAAGKAVLPGDKVVKVNDETTTKEMLRVCREQKLLKFTVQRGEVDDDIDPLSLGSSNQAVRNRGLTT